MEKFYFTVSEEEEGKPIKKVIRSKYSFSSRMMTKIKYNDLISVNGEKVPGWFQVKAGDLVTVSFLDETSNFDPEDIPIYPLYSDEDLLFINKQPGVTVHPTKGHPNHTIANGLMKYMYDNGEKFKVRFVNRLDMDTSGILLIAKNSMSQADLNRQMSQGETEKAYIALASGILKEKNFTIDLPIGSPAPGKIGRRVVEEDEGFPSVTEVEVLAVNPEVETEIKGINDESKKEKGVSLLKIKLLTGRTHQIRVHLSHLGHPLIGDPLYGGDINLFNRQALHAMFFSCTHPVKGGRLNIKAPLPSDMESLIKRMGFSNNIIE